MSDEDPISDAEIEVLRLMDKSQTGSDERRLIARIDLLKAALERADFVIAASGCGHKRQPCACAVCVGLRHWYRAKDAADVDIAPTDPQGNRDDCGFCSGGPAVNPDCPVHGHANGGV